MKKFIKSLGKSILILLVTLYVLFLVLPFVINPFLTKYSDNISKMAEENSGLKIKIEKLGIVTTPKLTIGIKIGHIEGALPNGDEFLEANNLQAKLSVLPLLAGKIKADVFQIKDINITLKIKPDGSLLIADYLPESKPEDNEEQLTELPLGLKLSNSLPNVFVDEYFMSVIDMRDNRKYSLQGANFKITNFVLNKKIKFQTSGTATLDGEKAFSYDLKIYNKIMPQVDINDLIFANNSTPDENNEKKTQNQEIAFNIIDILKNIKKNGLKADVKCDITIFGNPKDINLNGIFNVSGLSVLVNNKKLPDGHINFNLKDKKTKTDIELFTAEDEKTSIIGEIIYGKKSGIDLDVKSNATLHNLFELVKSVASSINYNELATLDGNGNINADFKIKSDLKSVSSDGYVKIADAQINYELYNILIDKIKADIDFNGNSINFKDVGFEILSQPLKLYGTLTKDAIADLHLSADKLPIKGLLVTAGQLNILKENDIKSGAISADISIKGKLSEIKPKIDINVNNINVTNKPSNTNIKVKDGKVKLLTDGASYNGDVLANSITVNNPSFNFLIPKVGVLLDNKDINIENTYLMLNSSRVDITGKISDYTTKNIIMNIKAKGAILASDIVKMLPSDVKSMFSAKGTLPVLMTVTGNDKAQVVNIQVLATPNGYLHLMDLQSVSGKSTLINSKINISNNSLVLENTGLYANNLTSLSDDISSNYSGNSVIKVSGGISDLSKLTLKNLNIETNGVQTISIPTFKNSSATLSANINLNGNSMTPDIKGNINCTKAKIPTLKTEFKNVTVDLGNVISANLSLIQIDNSVMNVKAVINSNFNNGIIIKNMDYSANMFDADTLISALTPLISGSGNSGNSNSASSKDLGIIIQNGKGTITKFKSGKIIATSLVSDFNLKNNIFTLKNLTGDAFKGKFNGHIGCNVINGHTTVDLTGTGMKAVEAIDAAAGIPNALSGTLNFGAKLALNAYAPSYNSMLKSTTGTINFSVKDGNYLNIGTIDQFVLAGNVAINTIIKAALLPIKKMPVIQNSSTFTELKGDIKLLNGIATLAPVKSSGNSISYFVTGKYDLLTGYTNVIVLGRMGADVVAVLGPLGQLSVSKLTAYLPKFGANTINLLSSLTSDPAQEQISQIPSLATGAKNYKDFKVLFMGNIMNATSVKSFKWLSKCDTSEIVDGSLKEQMKASINSIKQTGQNNINDAKKVVADTKSAVKTTSEDIKNQVQKTKESIQELKNLKNMFKVPSKQNTPITDEAQTTTQGE